MTRAPTSMTVSTSMAYALNASLPPRTGISTSPSVPGAILPVTRPTFAITVWSGAMTHASVPRAEFSVERDYAADPVLGLHQLEAAIDLVEREPVRDEELDV